MRGLYKKIDIDTTAFDLNASCRRFISNSRSNRQLRKKIRRKLRKTLDKTMNLWYN